MQRKYVLLIFLLCFGCFITGCQKTIKHGDRIAQLLFSPVPEVNWIQTTELEDTDRGAVRPDRPFHIRGNTGRWKNTARI